MANKKIELKIDGMTCQHCVATVKKTIAKFEGVENIDVEIGSAKFDMWLDLDMQSIKDAIADVGYAVV